MKNIRYNVLSKLNPLKKANELNENDLENIIINTKITLEKAISSGGQLLERMNQVKVLMEDSNNNF